MNLIRYLLRSARGIVLYTSVTALLSGACNAGLIALVNVALTNPKASRTVLAWSFVALGIGKLATTFLSQLALARYSQRATGDLRRDLVRKILAVPLRRLENFGAPRIMVAITEDVMNISQALLGIPGFAGNVAILFGGAVYLAWLSWKLLLSLCVVIAVGTLIYRVLIVRGFEYLHLAREEEDRLYGHFRALTEGIKELKLNRTRRSSFVSRDIQGVTEACQRHNVSAEIRFIMAQGWNHLLFYALIGMILFVLPGIQQITPQALTGYVVTTLYLMGPLAGVLGSISLFSRANVALSKIEQLGISMTSQVTEDFPLTPRPITAEFASLELAGVTHSYHSEKDDNHFMLGPVDLVFQPGELVFLVGGNGSGKSTLAKIITGLYPPEAGEIRLNGNAVTDRNRDDFRQNFSCVFADFHLFENLAGASCSDLDARALFYLRQLHLDHKVKIANGVLSTTALSQGQRKRLTLLMAYLEDRPFYLFDEWASDQDPQFKEIFYHQLLPELKARGKTVIAITHDDRYFPVADRVIKLDYGKIVSEEPVAAPHYREPALQGHALV
jgi:putative ATP-binding cassette transporter